MAAIGDTQGLQLSPDLANFRSPGLCSADPEGSALEKALDLGVVDRVTSGGDDPASGRNKMPAGFADGS